MIFYLDFSLILIIVHVSPSLKRRVTNSYSISIPCLMLGFICLRLWSLWCCSQCLTVTVLNYSFDRFIWASCWCDGCIIDIFILIELRSIVMLSILIYSLRFNLSNLALNNTTLLIVERPSRRKENLTHELCICLRRLSNHKLLLSNHFTIVRLVGLHLQYVYQVRQTDSLIMIKILLLSLLILSLLMCKLEVLCLVHLVQGSVGELIIIFAQLEKFSWMTGVRS
jgi:hypothetical protein